MLRGSTLPSPAGAAGCPCASGGAPPASSAAAKARLRPRGAPAASPCCLSSSRVGEPHHLHLSPPPRRGGAAWSHGVAGRTGHHRPSAAGHSRREGQAPSREGRMQVHCRHVLHPAGSCLQGRCNSLLVPLLATSIKARAYCLCGRGGRPTVVLHSGVRAHHRCQRQSAPTAGRCPAPHQPLSQLVPPPLQRLTLLAAPAGWPLLAGRCWLLLLLLRLCLLHGLNSRWRRHLAGLCLAQGRDAQLVLGPRPHRRRRLLLPLLPPAAHRPLLARLLCRSLGRLFPALMSASAFSNRVRKSRTVRMMRVGSAGANSSPK